MPDMITIQGYRAHIYFRDEKQRAKATILHKASSANPHSPWGDGVTRPSDRTLLPFTKPNFHWTVSDHRALADAQLERPNGIKSSRDR